MRNWMRRLSSLRPAFWLMLEPYSPGLDRFINASLDSGHAPRRTTSYTVELNGLTLWVGNWPYGYGENLGKRPSRVTLIRLRDAVDAADYPLTPATPK